MSATRRVYAPSPLATSQPTVTAGMVAAAFVINAAFIVALWWGGSGSELYTGQAGVANSIGRVTGLLGTYLALCQLLLMARVPWLEEALGMERMATLHRWNGYLTIGLLTAHGAFQTVGYAIANRMDPLGQLGDFIHSYPWMLPAVIGLVLMLVVVGTSIAISRREMAYETWYFVHLYAYLAVLLAFGHELVLGLDFSGHLVFVVYWVLLYLAVFGALVVYRVGRPISLLRRHGFQVARVVQEGPSVYSIYVSGRGMSELDARGGQFMIWRFLDRARWWQAHPFSLSALPKHDQLRLTFKNIGDFTARLAAVRPGTPILVEGPFGRFTADHCQEDRALLIAGGVGITAVRALAEDLARRGVDVKILYRCSRERNLIFREELDRLHSDHGVAIQYLLTDSQRHHENRGNWFHPQMLRSMVPDLAFREVFICGPAGMTATLVDSLLRTNVPSSRIHTEVFRF